jgi:hypothetical protein
LASWEADLQRREAAKDKKDGDDEPADNPDNEDDADETADDDEDATDGKPKKKKTVEQLLAAAEAAPRYEDRVRLTAKAITLSAAKARSPCDSYRSVTPVPREPRRATALDFINAARRAKALPPLKQEDLL